MFGACLAPLLKLWRHAVAKTTAGKKNSPDKPGELWICWII